MHLFAGVFKGNLGSRFKDSWKALLSGTLLAGLMLALAGLYEAASLILAGQFG